MGKGKHSEILLQIRQIRETFSSAYTKCKHLPWDLPTSQMAQSTGTYLEQESIRVYSITSIMSLHFLR